MNILHLQLFAKEVFCLFKVHVWNQGLKMENHNTGKIWIYSLILIMPLSIMVNDIP